MSRPHPMGSIRCRDPEPLRPLELRSCIAHLREILEAMTPEDFESLTTVERRLALTLRTTLRRYTHQAAP